MGNLALTAASNALDAITGRVTVNSRTTYLALLTAQPAVEDTIADLVEVTSPGTNGYARQQVTWSEPDGTPIATDNSGTVVFGPFSTDLDSVVSCALVTVPTGTAGDVLYLWDLDVATDPANGDTLTFLSGLLKISS